MQRQTFTTSPLSVAVAWTLSIVAATGVVVADVLTGPYLNLAMLKCLAVVICAATRNRIYVWVLTVLLTIAMFVVNYLKTYDIPDDGMHVYRLLNRAVAAVALVMVAGVLHLWIGRDIEAQQASEQLEAQNEELATREEEIARQNEELLSQTEELERQSEELRVINEELAARERMLESLLDLSRSLTAELTEEQVMKRVCSSVGTLIPGKVSSAAILLRKGDEAVVECHHGLAEDDAAPRRWAFDHSFASLVMGQGQPGYLEDVTLRPDLKMPTLAGGKPARSVLAAPLRVHGKSIGALEVYSTERQRWSSEHIALMESLAAQVSISLEASRLFEEVDRQRRRMETVFRTLPIGVLLAEDAQCLSVRGNTAAAAAYSAPADANFSPLAPPEQRVRRALYRAGHPAPLEQHPLVRATRDGEEIRNEEWEVLLSGGRSMVLLVSAAPIFDSRGDVVGGVCAFADITARKEIERELDNRHREAEEASLRKTRFLAAVSHDIRTPANAISLLAELIQRSLSTPALQSEIPQLASDLRSSAISLVDLVSDVLDVARFDSGKVDLQESEFTLEDAVNEECRHLLPLAQAKGLALHCVPPPHTIRLRADRIKLSRVINNLVGNAIKFTAQGEVRIETEVRDGDRSVVVRIIDTGIGIAPESLSHIFDEFVQLRNPERDRNKGMGLGLTICKRLVEAMGGSLDVTSELGVGSTFMVTLPSSTLVTVAPLAGEMIGPEGSLARDLSHLQVLLVEDHHSTRRATSQLISSCGARVIEAGDGITAIRLLENHQPNVLLLDLMLPDMDGREILRHLGDRRPDHLRCVLVLTGDVTPSRTDEVKRLGADGIIPKPVNLHQLLAHLENACPSEGNGNGKESKG